VDADVFRELLYAALDDFDPIAFYDSEAEDGLRVFFRDVPARDRAAAALKETFFDRLVELRSADVPDEDWARRSQAHLHAVRVGRIVVAPPWDVPSTAPDSIPIIIDPSMGFGTGHHETTRLCLALLQELDLVAARMVDVGTGSGVLAIAAARLGASNVVALDEDGDALANAAENVVSNNVEAIVSLLHADIARSALEPGQVVTANLTGVVLQRYAPQIRALVAGGGTLIVSGFSPDESREVVSAFGATIEREVREGEWAAASLKIPEARS
jgi:ribosomal protein L11 methyltransferase